MRTRLFQIVAIGAAAFAVACGVHQTDVPAVSGPSTLAHTVTITVTPDSVTQNGSDTATVRLKGFGPDGPLTNCAPVASCQVRLDILDDKGAPDDLLGGTLSNRTVQLDSSGNGTAIFTAPQPIQPPSGPQMVAIRATLIGTDAQTSSPVSAMIRVVPIGFIIPSNSVPAPQFTFLPATALANTAVVFDASTSCAVQLDSTGHCTTPITDIASFAWDFGDGGTGSGVSTSHSFGNANSYAVRLTVTNKQGISAFISHTVTIGAGVLPTPKFTFSPASPAAAQPVQFSASQSAAGLGHVINQYIWNFGDGSPTVTGVNVSHTFAVAAQYNVTLTVVDESGQQASTSSTVPVGTGAPTAIFTAAVTGIHTMTFDASASTAQGGATITQYQWSFGDGSFGGPSAAPSISHTFVAAGTYTVTVSVTDSLGRTGIFASAVTVP
jgi:PKD repeat protein